MPARYWLAAALVAGVILAWLAWPALADDRPEVDVAVVFVVDTSYSMDSIELEIARGSHVAAFLSPEVLQAIAAGGLGRISVAYVEFGGFAETLVEWTVVSDPASAEAFAARLEAVAITNIPQTSIGAGLQEAARLIDMMPYRATRIVVDVVGDGMNSSGPEVGAARNALLDRGVVINGMPLMLAPSDVGLDRYYETTIIGGPGAFSMPLTAIGQMPAALRQKIIQELY